MNDAKRQHSGNPAILWASLILFVLFGVQIAYQVYQLGSIFVCQKAMSSSSLNECVVQNFRFLFSLHRAMGRRNILGLLLS
jgi:hypothetical protein